MLRILIAEDEPEACQDLVNDHIYGRNLHQIPKLRLGPRET